MTTQEIKLKIHEEADLFSEYDPDQTLLSEDIASYFERNYLNKHRSPAEKYVIHIYSDTPVNKESIQTRIIKYLNRRRTILLMK